MQNNTHTSSSDSPTVYQGNSTSDEIDLKDILVKLWKQRKFILIVTGIFFLLGIFIAFTSPVSYTASCTLVPQSGKEAAGSNLGSFAAMMGVNIGSGSGETLSPSTYPQIVKSVPFIREIMQTPINVGKYNNEEVTLFDYYTSKENKSFNLLYTLKKYTVRLPYLIISNIRDNKKQKKSLVTALSDGRTSLITLSTEEEQVINVIKNSIVLNMSQKEGFITVQYTFSDAEIAALITDKVCKTLEKYIIAFKSEKAETTLTFVEQSFSEARQNFLKKQEMLVSFQDANRSLVTASARSTEQRLRSEYDIAFTVYNELAKQLEQAKLAVKESKPILTVINPVVVPTQKSAPKRSLILLTFILIGFIISTGYIFARHFFKSLFFNNTININNTKVK